ncbi:TIGR01244 family sulfur transferase [Phenylobacterium sp. SCN 70-31]|uniref:TIGR01244 family sulfur transferase n=1 Tax=Phenylobacterium sp. SCN 70-31 TaxID=1660129 RepID=UPI00086C21D1|nr:TIGR01244 family sulfur transferase [Phenylobacterium sp. SCN 70-31]ODT87349.1 MAG: TIGR01244 family protein [Phenylobacterium sp. SCN 70-31]
MPDFRRVTDEFTTAPQIALADVAEAARLGYRTLVNNRPDGEDPGQPASAEVEAAAKAAGLAYHHVPVRGGPTPEQVAQTQEILASAETPVLAFCRSGTRSIVTWSLCQAASGAHDRDELVGLGRAAGYDLSGVLGG